MMIISDENLLSFQAWSGAKWTKDRILEAGKEEDFEMMIDELFPQGIGETELNDILWFERDWIFETLGIEEE